ncbi:MAG: glyoxylate/hydroxypyruvate reductase A [Saprospiraceae bacterium]|nr:glyoxylate/hydroxypyruvate reductase A [Saprospiraceae bacterium]
MAILLAITDRDISQLQRELQEHLQGTCEVWAYPDCPDPSRVEMAVLWKHPDDLLQKLPNLKLISSLGAGVEHILADGHRPAGVPITRVVDDMLIDSMRKYILACVLSIHKRLPLFHRQQQESKWIKAMPPELPLHIGFLGLGELGAPIARSVATNGFEVWGYSRKPKEIKGVTCIHSGEESLVEFVRRINLLICLLPLTRETEGILNYELFRQMPAGSFLINAARGKHLVEEDLLRALDEGHIKEAFLDVFRQEPLPADHPFWSDPHIHITPHIASVTQQEMAAGVLAENYLRLKKEQPLLYKVSARLGY